MSNISPVNNVTNIIAENSLSNTQSQLQTTLHSFPPAMSSFLPPLLLQTAPSQPASTPTSRL